MSDESRAPASIPRGGFSARPAFVVYSVLFALHAASVILIGVLNAKLQSGYEELARSHAGWAEVHRRTAAMSRAAREANDPVNWVFSSSRPEIERERLAAALRHFFRLVERERSALAAIPVESQRARLLFNLGEGEERLQRMASTAADMFARLERRDKAGADAAMALADRQYGEFLDVMAERDSVVDGLQAELFEHGEAYRRGLGTAVLAGTVLMAFISLLLAGFGIRLAGVAQRAGEAATTSTEALERSEARLRETNARLEDSLRRQRRFIADAAHQLRTPIAGIRVQAARAARAADPGEVKLAIDQLESAAKRMTRLTNQLLSLARAERTPESASHDPGGVDLGTLVRESIRTHLAQAHERNIDLGLEESGGTARARGNRDLLEELVSNLLDNALRYTGEGGTVTARVIGGPSPAIVVTDDGPGIPQEERTRVLEPFYRLPGAPSSGSGLGLAIVQDIARAHGGVVKIGVPAGGRGTEVRVTLEAWLPAAG